MYFHGPDEMWESNKIAFSNEKNIAYVNKLETKVLAVSLRVFSKRTIRQNLVCLTDTEEKLSPWNHMAPVCQEPGSRPWAGFTCSHSSHYLQDPYLFCCHIHLWPDTPSKYNVSAAYLSEGQFFLAGLVFTSHLQIYLISWLVGSKPHV